MSNRFSVVAGDESRFVQERGTGYGDFEVRAIGDGIEETEEGGFGGGKTRVEGGGADGGDEDGGAGKGCEEEAVAEVGVSCEF